MAVDVLHIKEKNIFMNHGEFDWEHAKAIEGEKNCPKSDNASTSWILKYFAIQRFCVVKVNENVEQKKCA